MTTEIHNSMKDIQRAMTRGNSKVIKAINRPGTSYNIRGGKRKKNFEDLDHIFTQDVDKINLTSSEQPGAANMSSDGSKQINLSQHLKNNVEYFKKSISIRDKSRMTSPNNTSNLNNKSADLVKKHIEQMQDELDRNLIDLKEKKQKILNWE